MGCFLISGKCPDCRMDIKYCQYFLAPYQLLTFNLIQSFPNFLDKQTPINPQHVSLTDTFPLQRTGLPLNTMRRGFIPPTPSHPGERILSNHTLNVNMVSGLYRFFSLTSEKCPLISSVHKGIQKSQQQKIGNSKTKIFLREKNIFYKGNLKELKNRTMSLLFFASSSCR